MSAFLLQVLAVARTSVGLASLIMPGQISHLLGAPLSPPSHVIGRLFGIRDLVLGILLWKTLKATVDTKNGQAKPLLTPPIENSPSMSHTLLAAQHETFLRAAVLTGFIIDTVDVLSSAVCAYEGNLSDTAKIGVGVGAASFAALGGQYLFSKDAAWVRDGTLEVE